MTALPPLLLKGDCLVQLARIPDASIDAVVTDPPYGLDFMGKDWDNAVKLANGMLGQIAAGLERTDAGPLAKGGTHSQGYRNHDGLAFEVWTTRWAAECLRILKPGGHLLAFGGSRTWHRLAAGIEDAGFELRDSIAWLYGSGFPKSLDVSKAIDKAAGAVREVTSSYTRSGRSAGIMGTPTEIVHDLTAPATDAARQWQGWGTALKPAFEPIVVARKPLSGTVAANVLAHGAGALNIDASRIGADEHLGRVNHVPSTFNAKNTTPEVDNSRGLGRWPANVILDESQAAALDAQSGKSKSPGNYRRNAAAANASAYGKGMGAVGVGDEQTGYGDEGGASRFYYVAKAPKSERPVVDGTAHPTVKPLALMRWLCTLVTPPGGVVVDPFAGSGTTLEAAYMEGFEAIGVELTPDYWPLIEARIARAVARG